jgi:endonuclease G, mitochondrial
MKLPVELLQKSENEFRKDPRAVADIQAEIALNDAFALDGQAHVNLRRIMIGAAAREPVDIAFERYIGTNDLLPINYLAIGSMQAQAVGRIRYFDKRELKTAFATGFMVSPDIMMTNYHVFPVDDAVGFGAMADDATIEFNYEFDVNGTLADSVVHALDPGAFFHSFKDLDLALVAVRPSDISGHHQLSQQGYLVLNGDLGKAGTGDSATIIQHPDGQQKQIAIRSNEVIDNSLADVIIYKSDTAQGSSGAPVFNNEWQLIALHSAGVAKKDQQGNYLDKDHKIIPIIQGRVDEARIVWLSNRGVRVSAIMKHLKAVPGVATHPLGAIFSSPAYTDTRSFVALSDPKPPETESKLAQTIAAITSGVPAAAPVEIRISIGGGPVVVTSTPISGMELQGPPGIFEVEKKLEDNQDFTTCSGYEAEFLDDRIPMPIPSGKLRKKLAFLRDRPSAYVLKYHHYSTIQHAVRRVPVVSAINVPGKYRYEALGKESRKDNWLRDNRIDYDAQLDDKWYAKSGFDKGHMSRREDAEWGTTMVAAKAAADMTCSYANAAPQVPSLNRAIFGYHGKWGILEQDLLEKGIKLEGGKAPRVSIFAGPLFDDEDPVYASVQVALSFFKIVAWYKDDTLQATAFRLSQEKLVGGIEFEELHFDELLKTEQKPITWIEEATDLQFPNVLKNADTYKR